MNKWFQRIICFYLFILLTACAGSVEERPPEVLVPRGKNIAGLKIITEDGGHLSCSKKTNQNGSHKNRLTWFHAPKHPHYLAGSFAVAADFDWSPGENQIIALVITHRPDTRRRGSGLIVMIDLPTQ
jgi:hypothetical protein